MNCTVEKAVFFFIISVNVNALKSMLLLWVGWFLGMNWGILWVLFFSKKTFSSVWLWSLKPPSLELPSLVSIAFFLWFSFRTPVFLEFYRIVFLPDMEISWTYWELRGVGEEKDKMPDILNGHFVEHLLYFLAMSKNSYDSEHVLYLCYSVQ